MITIHTRENKKGKWWCNCTIKEQDVSFEGFTITDSQNQMRQYLNGFTDVKWNEPISYSQNLKALGNIQQLIASTTRLTH